MSPTLLMKWSATRALKASYLDRSAAPRCSTCLWKTKRRLLKSWHGRRGITSSDQPLPLPYLLPSSSLSMWTRTTLLRPRIDRQRRSCLVPVGSLWPRVGHQGWPYLVSNHAHATSIWLSMTAMLGPYTITTTMNWLLVITLLGSIVAIELQPWVSCRDCYAWS